MFGLFGGSKVLSINITGQMLSVAALALSRKGVCVESFHAYPLAPGVVEYGVVAKADDFTSTLRVCFQELLPKYSNKKIPVHLSFVHPEAFIKRLALPYEKDPAVLRRLVRLELEQYIVGDFSKLTFGYQLESVGEVAFVLAAAAPAEVVSSYLQLIQSQNMKKICIGLSALGTSNYAFYNNQDLESQKVLFLDIHGDLSEAQIWAEGVLENYIVFNFGTSFFDNSIATELKVSAEEAASLRRAHAAGQPGPEQLGRVLSENAEFFIGELRTQVFRSAKFKVDTIYVGGEGGKIKELRDLLQSKGRVQSSLDAGEVQFAEIADASMQGNEVIVPSVVGTGLQAVIG